MPIRPSSPALFAAALWAAASLLPGIAHAGTYTTIHSFGLLKKGVTAVTGPLIAYRGALYGAGVYGGAHDFGAIFHISPGGTETTLYSFTGGPDGGFPSSPLIAVGGSFAGTTEFGGANAACPGISDISGCGVVYSLTPRGAETVLYTFQSKADGVIPDSLLAVPGGFYGTTAGGGTIGGGTAFFLTGSGQKSDLHDFGAIGDGTNPNGLIPAGSGFFGTTSFGGPALCSSAGSVGCGTVFQLQPSGYERVTYAFGATENDGEFPAGLTRLGRTLYGTTGAGGPLQCGGFTQPPMGCGTVFSLAANGDETVLHHFSGTDGQQPIGGLTYLNGAYYGVTITGGANRIGVLYSITPSGAFTVLHNFAGGTDGSQPAGGLTLLHGTFYGVTQYGGARNAGTVFTYTP